MNAVSSYVGKELEWVQPNLWKREYVLQAKENEERPASLVITGVFKRVVTVSGFGGTWIFTKPSIWRSTIDITESGKTLPFAQFSAKKFGKEGLIQLPKGERLRTVLNVWKGKFSVLSDYDIELLVQERVIGMKRNAKLMLLKESNLLEKYPWVIMLVFYLQLMQNQRSS